MKTSPYTLYGTLCGVLCALMLLVGMVWCQLPFLVAYLLSINLTTLGAYGYDKKIASTSLTRVPEKLLHALSLVGGSPGALVGQRLFRHKTVKRGFQIAYWFIVLIQLIVLVMVIW